MNKGSPSITELLISLQDRKLITEAGFMRITQYLSGTQVQPRDPLYIRILSGIGAWVAAFFLVGFLALAHVLEARMASAVLGVVFLAGGIGIARASKATFLVQLSLALVFAGNILVMFGFTSNSRNMDISVLVIVHAIVCFVVYPLFSNTIYRFLAPVGLAALVTAWIIDKRVFVLVHFLIAAETILAGKLLLLKKRRESLTPLIYSAAAMLPATLLFMNLTQMNAWRVDFRMPLWPSSIILTAGLIYLYFHLYSGGNPFREPLLTVAVLSTVVLGIFTTPGILVAIGLLIVSYAFADRILAGFSYLFLLCFLVVFYYALNVDLAHKSWAIAGSGVLLLVVRWIAGFFKTEDMNP